MKNKDITPENQEFTEELMPEAASDETTPETDTVAEDSAAADDEDAKMATESNEWQEKYLRLSAEFDNFRKRTLKEKMELVVSGGEGVLKAILPVVDDLDRALEAMSKRDDMEAEREGLRLIYQKFLDTLRSKGVTPIEALGAKMDVDFHDAVAKVPVEEAEKKGVVIDVLQSGYMLGDRVLRFARVVVGE